MFEEKKTARKKRNKLQEQTARGIIFVSCGLILHLIGHDTVNIQQ